MFYKKEYQSVRNVYTVKQVEMIHNEVQFILNEKKQFSQLQSTGQVIVDSDNETFLYIIEENNAYSYVSFEKQFWSQLLQMILLDQKPFLCVEDAQFELTQFAEELTALLYNIEGNGNYGDSFVKSVEEAFAKFYAKQ